MSTPTRQIQLTARPHGEPVPTDFRTVETELPAPGAGEVLVRNTFLSVDPYMRGRMNDTKSYVPPYVLDAPMEGGAVGEVVESNDDSLSPGDTVLHMAGWREHAVLPASAARRNRRSRSTLNRSCDAITRWRSPSVLGESGNTRAIRDASLSAACCFSDCLR